MDTRLKERVLKAQTDENELNSFIAEWEPFILDVASNVAERMITRQDEEWTVAWSSFYEAIKRYTEDRGDFKHYAEILVRKRVLDYTMFLEQSGADISKVRKKKSKERKTGFYSPESAYEAPSRKSRTLIQEFDDEDDFDDDDRYDDDDHESYDVYGDDRGRSSRGKRNARNRRNQNLARREKRRKNRRKAIIIFAAVVVAAACTLLAMFMPYTVYHVKSEASVAYTTNILGKVIDENASNKEGKMVISAVDAHNKDIDDVLEKTIKEMIKQGFVSEDEDHPISLYATGAGKEKANEKLEGLELRINKQWEDMLEEAHKEKEKEEKKKKENEEKNKEREEQEEENNTDGNNGQKNNHSRTTDKSKRNGDNGDATNNNKTPSNQTAPGATQPQQPQQPPVTQNPPVKQTPETLKPNPAPKPETPANPGNTETPSE